MACSMCVLSEQQVRDFGLAWDQLAGEGRCDARPGVLYAVILRSWFHSGCPADIRAFIAEREAVIVGGLDTAGGNKRREG